MKTTERIRAVRFDNRKRVLHVDYASGKRIGVHYGHLGLWRRPIGEPPCGGQSEIHLVVVCAETRGDVG